MMIRNRDNLGFTFIELIIVISILAILSAIAIPKLFSISGDAQNAATQGIAGALSAANAQNYAVRVEKSTNGSAVANCTAVSSLLSSGLPAGYTIVSASVAVNTSVICTLNGPSSSSATFLATGIT